MRHFRQMESTKEVLDVVLATPPVPELVPALAPPVFDDFAWSPPVTLSWRTRSPLDRTEPLTRTNPGGMVFLFLDKCAFLPRELARLHVPELLRADEAERHVLAPYAIDDATDLLHEHRVPARSVLGLATASLAGLFWGLHDWAHFHHHGPFEERAWTELQCDAAALSWLHVNRVLLGLDDAELAALVDQAGELTHARFAEENRCAPVATDAWNRVVAFLSWQRRSSDRSGS
jgi:hypothetical protein